MRVCGLHNNNKIYYAEANGTGKRSMDASRPTLSLLLLLLITYIVNIIILTVARPLSTVKATSRSVKWKNIRRIHSPCLSTSRIWATVTICIIYWSRVLYCHVLWEILYVLRCARAVFESAGVRARMCAFVYCTARRPGARFRRSSGGGGGMVKMLRPPRKTRRVRLGCVRARATRGGV